ncbi:MAG: C39 family peptidase [Phycisphaerae bacterium]
MQVSLEQIGPVLNLYNAGLYLQAYQESQNIAPLPQWRSTAGRIMAGRLAGNLGSSQLGKILHYRAYREDSDAPEAWYYYAHVLLNQHGPLDAWQFVRAHTMPDSAPAELRSNWYGIKARISGILRDFMTAKKMLDAADEIYPDDPWLAVERCSVLERQDRYNEALSAVMRGLEIRPWYRPAVQSASHIMQLLDKEDQALDLLTQATQRNESVALVLQLATLQTEMRSYQDARLNVSKAFDLAPLMDKQLRDWLMGIQSDAAYFCSDLCAAAELAAKSKNRFYQKIAAKLKAADGTGSRVMLPVGFVRQHHMTCGPAVVACLGRFWNKPIDHLALAHEICYDGTPDRALRQWAGEHGWLVREFRVTWETSRALIDRGIPFAVATVEPASAHLQAVIGYDELRGTLIIRDPYIRPVVEFVSELTLERYASTGPLGIVLIPIEQQQLLDGVNLCDAALYDGLHEVNAALHRHDRPCACAAREATYAVGNLFDMELAAGNFADAARLEKLLSQHAAPERSSMARLELAAARNDKKMAMTELISLCRMPSAEPWLLERALEVLAKRSWSDSIGYYVREALNQDDCNVIISELSVRCLARRNKWQLCREFVDSLSNYAGALNSALLEFIQQLADHNKFQMFAWLMRRYRTILRGDTELWGKTGYALKRFGRYRRVIAWMRDWRDRADVQPWMLANLAASYRAIGHRLKAIHINQFAVKMDSEPAGRAIHALWLAADAVLVKQPAAAKAWLTQGFVTPNSPPYHRFIKAIVDAALQRYDEPQVPFAVTRKQMIDAKSLFPGFQRTREIRALYRHCLLRIATSNVGLSGMIWCRRDAMKSL